MNTENNIKEFGFCHISINTVYNGIAGNAVRRYHASLTSYFILIPPYRMDNTATLSGCYHPAPKP